jgi:hypothetical protein
VIEDKEKNSLSFLISSSEREPLAAAISIV